MLSHDFKSRFSIENVCNHPYFWTEEQKYQKFYELQEAQIWRFDVVVTLFEKSCAKEIAEWKVGMKLLDNHLEQAFYETSDVFENDLHAFIKWVRNGISHCHQWPKAKGKLLALSVKHGGAGKSPKEYFIYAPEAAWFLPRYFEICFNISKLGQDHAKLMNLV